MNNNIFKAVIATALSIFVLSSIFSTQKQQNNLPIIAIANYGPHPSLEKTIQGIKEKLTNLGYIEGKNIKYIISNVNFDTSLIPQMITSLKASKPKVIVAISTPVAQNAKNIIKDIPIIYTNITNPKEAGLQNNSKQNNITGTSDKLDLNLTIAMAKDIIPSAKTMGVLYSTGEANDLSMITELKIITKKHNINLLAIPVEHSRDVALRMQSFKNKVDFIYTGSSGAIQSALPAIASMAQKMQIPHFNFNTDEVLEHKIFASYGISYNKIGANTAVIIDKILKGTNPQDIPPLFPQQKDHKAFISKKRAEKINLSLPNDLNYINIVE